mgnify:FL=1
MKNGCSNRKYDFDKITDRRNTGSVKFDSASAQGKPEDILPLWVADMDFPAPPCVIDALVKRSQYGIFGYSISGSEYFKVLRSWFSERFVWDTQPEWVIQTPGVVFAIHIAVRALTEKGDAILIQEPVYHSFSEAIGVNDRRKVVNPLAFSKGRYSIDFEDFENKIVQNKVKLFILCSPHNPVGRVWTREELKRMGDICLKHDVIVVSDEIHADFTYPGHQHHVFAGLNPEFSNRSVICTAPTKTFNLAGLQISNIFISNPDIHRRFRQEMRKCGSRSVNLMGIIACRAAYEGGGEWLDELKHYLSGNLGFLRDFLRERLPQIKLVEPEGTYLVWLDFHALGLEEKELENFLVNRAGLWLETGTLFGEGGEGFQRMNIACPRSFLEKALLHLENAVRSLSDHQSESSK